MALGFGLGYGLAERSGDVRWAAAGAAIAAGWAFLGLHNDCRYKAFFQRLKASTRSYRVDGGSGGRPSPPPGWPRRGKGVVTWPAFKACEGHVVLVALTGLGGLALVWPDLWMGAWRWAVRGMAILAPGLASARVAKAIAGGSIEAEFGRWFRPADGAVIAPSRVDGPGDEPPTQPSPARGEGF